MAIKEYSNVALLKKTIVCENKCLAGVYRWVKLD